MKYPHKFLLICFRDGGCRVSKRKIHSIMFCVIRGTRYKYTVSRCTMYLVHYTHTHIHTMNYERYLVLGTSTWYQYIVHHPPPENIFFAKKRLSGGCTRYTVQCPMCQTRSLHLYSCNFHNARDVSIKLCLRCCISSRVHMRRRSSWSEVRPVTRDAAV